MMEVQHRKSAIIQNAADALLSARVCGEFYLSGYFTYFLSLYLILSVSHARKNVREKCENPCLMPIFP